MADFDMNVNFPDDEQQEAMELKYLGADVYEETPREVFATKSESVSIENASAKLAIRVPWDQRFETITDLFEGGENGNPREYPYQLSSSGSKLYAVNISNIEPMQTKYNNAGQAIGYEWAILTVTYEPLETQVTITSTTEYVKVNPAGLYWDTMRGGEQMYIPVAQDQAPGIPIRSFEISLTRRNMVTFDIFKFEGTCNSKPIKLKKRYLGDVFEFPAETLAVQSPEVRTPEFLFSGSGRSTVSCKLVYNPLGHNQWYDPLQDSSEDDPDPDKLEYHTVHMCKAIKKEEGGGSESEKNDHVEVKPLAPVNYDEIFERFDIKEF